MSISIDNAPRDPVSEADRKESLEMLKTRVGQINAVFACFGSAVQYAQFFEAALTEFLRDYNKIANQSLTVEDFVLLDKKLQKKTLGALLKEFAKYVTIKDPKVTQFLELALDRRNFLIHHFFLERDAKFQSEQERMSLLSELVSIGSLLERAAKIVRGMGIALTEAIAKKRGSDGSDGKTQVEDEKVLFTAEVKLPDDL